MAKNNDQQERTSSLGFEDKLWAAADLLRNNMDPAEYKHVVLGLLFLKSIEDTFEERREAIRTPVADPKHPDYIADPKKRQAELADLLEDRDEYTAVRRTGGRRVDVPAHRQRCMVRVAPEPLLRRQGRG